MQQQQYNPLWWTGLSRQAAAKAIDLLSKYGRGRIRAARKLAVVQQMQQYIAQHDYIARYCPLTPTPKQQLLLNSPHSEVLYGGAAGGGKSVALLMLAVRYMAISGASVLYLRRDVSRLRLAGGPISLLRQWVGSSTDATWSEQQSRMHWNETGATLQFGYLASEDDKHRYASSAYQCIIFDELTEFRREDDYLFLRSRLRAPNTGPLAHIPLTIRAASNPGGPGHRWVRERFIPSEMGAEETYEQQQNNEIRQYIPARIRDNPYLRADEYRQSLSHLPPITRARLLNGDWSIREDGLIKAEWVVKYSKRGTIYVTDQHQHDEHDCYRFVTVDTAGSSGNTTNKQKGKSSRHAIATWDYHARDDMLYCVDYALFRCDYPALKQRLAAVNAEYSPAMIHIENATLGPSLVSEMASSLPVQLISTRVQRGAGQSAASSKEARATDLLSRMERGRMAVGDTPGIQDATAEWMSWTGGIADADAVDVASYAATIALKRHKQGMRVVLPQSFFA